jgi:hypothetical protein
MERWWLIAWLVLWAVLLFGGFMVGTLDTERTRRMPTWTRMASSCTLVIAGWSFFWLYRVSGGCTFVLLIAVGMTLGFIGDLFMAKLLPLKEYFLGGIAAFGLGHIAYIFAQLVLGAQYDLGRRWDALIVWLVIGLAGWYIVVYRTPTRSMLHYAALPYALLLSSTAGIATGLALQAPVFIPLAVGATLFLLSDLILAARLFNNLYFYLIDDVVWLLYGPAQMLIVYSIGSTLVFDTLFTIPASR